MTLYFHEHVLREQFREMAAQDRQLERWAWFQRHVHHPGSMGWMFRVGCRSRGVPGQPAGRGSYSRGPGRGNPWFRCGIACGKVGEWSGSSPQEARR